MITDVSSHPQSNPSRSRPKNLKTAKKNPKPPSADQWHVLSNKEGVPGLPKKGDHCNTRLPSAPGGRKATNDEIQKRIDEVALLLCQQQPKSAIKEFMRNKYGLKALIVEILYIKRARQQLERITNMSADDGRKMGIEVILNALQTGTVKEKLTAERSLANILGYDKPKTLEHVGQQGGPIQHQFNILVAQEELP